MFEKEKEKLTLYKSTFDHIDIPVNSLDDAIFAGFQKAKLESRRKPRILKWQISLVVAAMVLIGFFTSIRLSPAFADYMTIIPGMEKIVNLIRFDKGRMAAVENDYYEKIGASDDHDGIKFTVDGVIADEKGLDLFYTVKTDKKFEQVELENIHLSSLEGENLTDYSGNSGSIAYKDNKDKKTYSGRLEYFFEKEVKTKNFKLDVNVKNLLVSEKYSVQFALQNEKKVRKTYELNKTRTIDGQKITFVDATIYPLRVAVHIKMDPTNSKRVLKFEDLRLVDENGETWNEISNGLFARNISADELIIFLQSNYFSEPKELYLVLDKIQAIDKGDVNIVVDTVKGQILKQPKEKMVKDFNVEGNDLVFGIQSQKLFDNLWFTYIKDGKGKQVISPSGYKEVSDETAVKKYAVNIPNLKNYANPLSLELTYYPSWIKGHEKIRIK